MTLTTHRFMGRLIGYLYCIATGYHVKLSSTGSIGDAITRLLPYMTSEQKQIIDSIITRLNTMGSVQYDAMNPDYKTGYKEAVHVFTHGNLQSELLCQDSEIDTVDHEAQRKKRRRMTIAACVLVILVAAVMIYHHPYFEEQRAYNEAMEALFVFDTDHYLETFPDGKHMPEVRMLRARLELESERYAEAMEDLRYVEYKFKTSPQGRTATHMLDSIWEEKLSDYRSRDHSAMTSEAREYMKALFDYMQSHRVNVVGIAMNRDVNLKEYSDYDTFTQRYYESMDGWESETPILSVKDNFTDNDFETYEAKILQGFKSKFDNWFGYNFIKIKPIAEMSGQITPLIHIDYEIRTQSFSLAGHEVPNIWVYKEGFLTKAYIPGLHIAFRSHLTVPNSETTYTYAAMGSPEDEVRNIENLQDAYQKMTGMCFSDFVRKVTLNLGLPIYLPAEEESVVNA